MSDKLKEKLAGFLKNLRESHFTLAWLALFLVFPVIGYALTISNFTDYSPPGGLYITWWDYYSDSQQNQASSNNAVTDFPSWSAQYPYRAIFLGGTPASGALQGHSAKVFIVYSKKSLADSFTFSYLGNGYTKGSNNSGYIRAFIKKGAYGVSGTDSDIVIRYAEGWEMTSGLLQIARPNNFSGYTYGSHNTIGDDVYFDFDFYYECADEHQQNASNLNINGLRSVTDCSYSYIIHCSEHGSSASASGGSSSSGSSSSTSSSSGNSSDINYGGGGSLGGGINPGTGGYKGGRTPNGRDPWGNPYPDISSGSPNSNGSGITFNPPSNWDDIPDYGNSPNPYPWEDEKNIPDFDWDIDIPPYIPGREGDDGERGDTWTIPVPEVTPPKISIPVPEMPNRDKFGPITFPPDLRFTSEWPPPFVYD